MSGPGSSHSAASPKPGISGCADAALLHPPLHTDLSHVLFPLLFVTRQTDRRPSGLAGTLK